MAEREKISYWGWAALALFIRLFLIPISLSFTSRPEIATPLTSIRRLAEGQWLKQSSFSPYAGSMYHGSPLLLSVLGPLTVCRTGGVPSHILLSLVLVIRWSTRLSGFESNLEVSIKLEGIFGDFYLVGTLDSGDVAALIYLFNPLTIAACAGSSTSPIENMMILLTVYGACAGVPPLAAFGWVIATHLSIYSMMLVIPIIILLGYGLDTPPKKLFKTVDKQKKSDAQESSMSKPIKNPLCEGSTQQDQLVLSFSWRPIIHFMLWAGFWSLYVLGLCSVSLKGHGGLREMFNKTYGFILNVEDLSPNLGVFWYFFAEVFDFFRDFFLLVFHANILFMISPLVIRLNHRPCFLAFVYIAISSILKSYPSVGDSALYLGMMGLFFHELAGMRFSLFLLSGYIGVSLLSPVMHNLWIWRGTGNANFYFATALAYACFQILLVVESVGTMLNHDRMFKQQCNSKTRT
ncbi:phosphatidylinositol glycan anchor biosynthesis class U protein [Amborella trichopoda]|uniref:phosphatidylinositol glycan anchor biosynthesis class U protein n=1 Tax=Amborella trichopoda TaxID=13333 RepID=UPI0005D4293B|nr:phosphatidylinositol glycan anchor biosynthesis class U protein [Amborella trichopoda]|eukprot:XP_011621261.1 phosphatidylinositol glycan anchor biosynthesis class U protein [Amborella trichopoda]